ncbi:hypothetical protein PVAG01_07293 [Phlyctema vagabunda]|uniref:Uncharacterized protein n=1 Tax=Phlyctema vagabunda TaxID=108571 RepID=A0ABR4PC25_9HELO
MEANVENDDVDSTASINYEEHYDNANFSAKTSDYLAEPMSGAVPDNGEEDDEQEEESGTIENFWVNGIQKTISLNPRKTSYLDGTLVWVGADATDAQIRELAKKHESAKVLGPYDWNPEFYNAIRTNCKLERFGGRAPSRFYWYKQVLKYLQKDTLPPRDFFYMLEERQGYHPVLKLKTQGILDAGQQAGHSSHENEMIKDSREGLAKKKQDRKSSSFNPLDEYLGHTKARSNASSVKGLQGGESEPNRSSSRKEQPLKRLLLPRSRDIPAKPRLIKEPQATLQVEQSRPHINNTIQERELSQSMLEEPAVTCAEGTARRAAPMSLPSAGRRTVDSQESMERKLKALVEDAVRKFASEREITATQKATKLVVEVDLSDELVRQHANLLQLANDMMGDLEPTICDKYRDRLTDHDAFMGRTLTSIITGVKRVAGEDFIGRPEKRARSGGLIAGRGYDLGAEESYTSYPRQPGEASRGARGNLAEPIPYEGFVGGVHYEQDRPHSVGPRKIEECRGGNLSLLDQHFSTSILDPNAGRYFPAMRGHEDGAMSQRRQSTEYEGGRPGSADDVGGTSYTENQTYSSFR